MHLEIILLRWLTSVEEINSNRHLGIHCIQAVSSDLMWHWLLYIKLLCVEYKKEFSSLRALITHHSVMPELLPVPLTLPRPTNMGAGAPGSRHGSRGSELDGCDDFDTYGSLNDFRKMMADLNV